MNENSESDPQSTTTTAQSPFARLGDRFLPLATIGVGIVCVVGGCILVWQGWKQWRTKHVGKE